MTPRRLILSITLLICLILGAAGVIFVTTFDINNYRNELEETLSDALARPVSLGMAQMVPGFGLSLTFDDLVVGAKDTPFLTADRLSLNVRMLSLLTTEVTFSRVSLLRPTLHLNARERTNGTNLDQEFSGGALIRSLRILDGKIIWTGGDPQQPRKVIFDHFNAKIKNLATDQPINVQLQTRLNSNDTSVQLKVAGTLTQPDQRDWRWIDANLDIRADALTAASLNELLPTGFKVTADNMLTTKLQLHGSPHSGLKITSELVGKNPQLKFQKKGSFSLKGLSFSGIWTAGEEQHIDQLRLATNDAVIAGYVTFSGTPSDPHCAGHLTGTVTDLKNFRNSYRPWLPKEVLDPSSLSGQLQLTAFEFSGPLSTWNGPIAKLPVQHAEIQLTDIAGTLANRLPFSNGHTQLKWENNRLTLSNGRARLVNQPLTYSGTLINLAVNGKLDLRMDGTLTPDVLSALHLKLPTELALSGNVPIILLLDGLQSAPKLHLSANLTPLSIDLDPYTFKKVGEHGLLVATLAMTDKTWQLSDSRLELPFVTLRALGEQKRTADRSFQLAFSTTPTALSELTTVLPELAFFQPSGAISASYRISGAPGQPTQQAGTLQLHEIGVTLNNIVGDISGLDGTLKINPEHIVGTDITARIGVSPVKFDLKIADLANPIVDVALRIPKIYASELIFNSPTRTLHDLDAQLRITADSIDFSSVHVRLPSGTIATVTGQADWRQQVRVELDIEGEWADVDEIIGLWSDPHDPPPLSPPPVKTDKKKGPGLFVDIGVIAHKGVFHNFKFRDATARIVWRDDQLIIHPLTFYGDPGFCTGQVIFKGTSDTPARLRVSGYGNGFEAATVYESLLQKDAPLSGTLRTGFYLDGQLNGHFIDTLDGGVSLTIKDGVLRRFKVLSKVFSVLNVSQIFEFKLPDMALKGMPFDRLDASFDLTDGTLRTEDLFIKSKAMNLSLIGDINLGNETLDLVMGVKPLRTVDRIITKIPLAGWILTGEEKALITAQFEVNGPSDDPQVKAIPITSLSDTVFGIFKRIFGLPAKVVTDVGELFSE